MSYTHLSSHERSVIQHLHRQGVNASQIAKQLGRDRSTIGRELRRNAPTADGYVSIHGFTRLMPACWKCRVFRVASVPRRAATVPAMSRSRRSMVMP